MFYCHKCIRASRGACAVGRGGGGWPSDLRTIRGALPLENFTQQREADGLR